MPSRTLSPAITTLPMADACENRLEDNLRDGEDAAQGSTASHRESEPIEEGEAPAPASGSAEETRVDRDVDESWKDELIEEVQGQSKIRDWSLLRKKLKDDLQNKSRTLPLTRVNQFMILINFTMLRLKGFSRIDSSLQIARQWHEGSGNWFACHVRALARHYQLFEVLPIEKRGGSENAHSWLHNEAVQKRTQDWLVTQPIGKVTPRRLRDTLNSIIFPDLNIFPKAPLGDRTARRWLIRLGWRRMVVQKGVYMDGHERADVIKYHQDVFLPLMASLEHCMVRFEGPELVCIEPELHAGEVEVRAYWHDESIFHVNDEARNLWLRDGEQPLRKKGRGQLIHVSDFICEETGRLVIHGDSGEIVKDARHIIYPGSNADAWWDSDQLLAQVNDFLPDPKKIPTAFPNKEITRQPPIPPPNDMVNSSKTALGEDHTIMEDTSDEQQKSNKCKRNITDDGTSAHANTKCIRHNF
ncbi:hypothetical protein WOLCODRAFT_155522 [Wolfiporia cocos MD-104 SS10]|uniref:Uncharacterized protein n=1 Tax=Wolfiporia cocos (strain MD-104) TaxID=742152 RepID=A0A2H3IYR2_WOLCO|nr:hypothetical protein WOLCODRAFT_155522 [Wolfiporia cocos MD-104 SS10]